jgi:hypothetical protein
MNPTLEQDIEELEKLDSLRAGVSLLRNQGLEALLKASQERDGLRADDPKGLKRNPDQFVLQGWCSEDEEPRDLIQPAIQLHTLTSRFASQMHRSEDKQEYFNSRLDKLRAVFRDNLTLKVLMERRPNQYPANNHLDWQGEPVNEDTSGGENPDQASRAPQDLRSRVEVFQAVRVFQSLIRSPESFFLKGSILAYYRIVRELHSVAEPNWFIGAARASEGGVPTAFMTGECTRAINAFATAIKGTADLLNLVTQRAQSLMAITEQEQIPLAWRYVEATRQMMSIHVKVSALRRESFVTIEDELINPLVNLDSRPDKEGIAKCKTVITEFLAGFAKQIGTAAEAAMQGARQAKADIKAWNKQEVATARKTWEADGRSLDGLVEAEHPDAKATLSHRTALHAIAELEQLAGVAITVAGDFKEYVTLLRDQDEAAIDRCKRKKKAIEDFYERLLFAKTRIRKVFTPAKAFVESVLDRELAKADSGRVNVGELTFAAATYAEIARPASDVRLVKAVQLVFDAITEDGTFDSPGHLDTDGSGYSLLLLGSEVIRVLAQLLDRMQIDVPLEQFLQMLRYFETTSVKVPEGGELAGWCHDMPRYPRKAASWTSALAILALDRVGRLLDKTINRRVAAHFSTRSGQSLSDAGQATLGVMIYPDYGAACYGPPENFPREIYGKSIAHLLESMRAHILGVSLGEGARGACNSLILYGPPGTGKTTAIEAVAASTRSVLFEVTPSDFLVEGEAFVEKRARVVFTALSLLTNAIIILDEFDPMLRSREVEPADGKRSVFSFLTPGLLPKLKNLNVKAKRRNTAFCLITNRIGTLDDAAIRSGRFDYKIGIYPPDLLSRTGYVAWNLEVLRESKAESMPTSWWTDTALLTRVIEVLHATEGAPMTMLSEEGNLRKLSRSKPTAKQRKNSETILGYILEGGNGKYKAGAKDAKFDEKRLGSGTFHEYETRQWQWIMDCDAKFTEFATDKEASFAWGEIGSKIKACADSATELAVFRKRERAKP